MVELLSRVRATCERENEELEALAFRMPVDTGHP
jgi:hypothetical protein